jgi:hypothetical protein
MSEIMIEVGRLQQRSVSVLNGLTARLEEGQAQQIGDGVHIIPVPPLAPGQPAAGPAPQVYVLLGKTVLATFNPDERAEAEQLVAEVNAPLEKVRGAYEKKMTERMKQVLSSKK